VSTQGSPEAEEVPIKVPAVKKISATKDSEKGYIFVSTSKGLIAVRTPKMEKETAATPLPEIMFVSTNEPLEDTPAQEPPQKLPTLKRMPTDPEELVMSEELFQCHKCGKEYTYKRNLMRHLRLECGTERQFICELCEQRFRQKTHLVAHVTSKHCKDF